jgi:excisionase family DNA binding protein
MTPANDRLLSIREASAKLGVGKTTLYSLLFTEKKITAIKIGNRTLVAESEVDRFIAELLKAAA